MVMVMVMVMVMGTYLTKAVIITYQFDREKKLKDEGVGGLQGVLGQIKPSEFQVKIIIIIMMRMMMVNGDDDDDSDDDCNDDDDDDHDDDNVHRTHSWPSSRLFLGATLLIS